MKKAIAAIAVVSLLTIGCRGISVGSRTDCRSDPITLQTKCSTSILRGPFALPTDPGTTDSTTGATTNLLADYVSMGGAGAIVIDVTGSTVGLPSEGPVTVSLVNSAGIAYVSRQFRALRRNQEFVPANPAEVDAWMFANAGTAVTYDAAFGPITVTTAAGSNAYQNTLEVQGVPIASSGRSWSEPTCQSCRYVP